VSEVLTSDQAERAVLGSILLDGQRVMPLARGVAGLTPEAFGVIQHRVVAEAMWAMAEDSKRYIDLVTLDAELQRTGKIDAAGGSALLCGLIDDTPTAAHAEYYIQLVREKWLLRKTLFVTQGLQADIHAGPENVEEFVRQAPDRFTGLIGTETREVSNIEVMDANITKWEDAVAYRLGDTSKAPAIGLSTPFEEMTKMLCGLEPGITIIAGRPSAGKTTLEDMLSIHAAMNGVAVGRVTLDSTRSSLLARAQCRIAGVSMPKLKHGFGRRDQIEACRQARDQIGNLRMWIRTDLADVASIRMWALERKRKDGMGMLTIDYAQQVRASELGRAESDRVARMTHVIARLKKLALDELEIPVLVLSQLNRQSEKDGADPGLSDLRDSGALEQDADKVVMLYIDKKKRKEMDEADPTATKHKRPVVFGVAKHKDGETGSLPLWMYPPYFRFEIAEDEWADDWLPGDKEELEREFAAVPHLRPRDELLPAEAEDD
jgi:replicative DNA helicase